MSMSNSRKQKSKAKAAVKASRLHFIFWSCCLLLAAMFVTIFALFLEYKRLPVSPLSLEQIVIVTDSLDSKNKETYLASINVKTSEIQVFVFSPNVKMNVLGGFGEYGLHAVLPLLKIEQKTPQYQLAAFGWGLGTSVDQLWIKNTANKIDSPASFKKFFHLYTRQQISVDTSFLERLKLAEFANSLRDDQIQVHPIDQPEQWQKYALQLTNSKQTECSVAVINATQVSGLASKFSSILESSGLYVIRVADTSDFAENSSIFILPSSESACTESMRQGENLFPFPITYQLRDTLYEQYRADAVFILGNDLGALQVSE